MNDFFVFAVNGTSVFFLIFNFLFYIFLNNTLSTVNVCYILYYMLKVILNTGPKFNNLVVEGSSTDSRDVVKKNQNNILIHQ